MQRLMKSAPVFLVVYLLLMIPTYVLGVANSFVFSVLSVAGGGLAGLFPPQWWAQLWVLAALVIVAWSRGASFVGKGYLPLLSFLAAVFDMAPILRAIPFVPTIFHLLVLILGVVGAVAKDEADDDSGSPWQRPGRVLLVASAIALFGAVGSALLMGRHLSSGGQSEVRVNAAVKPMQEKKAAVIAPVVPAVPVVQPVPAAPAAAVPVVPVAPVAPVVAPEKPAVSVASSAVDVHLSAGRGCLSAKRFDCAMKEASAALRLESGSSAAKALLDKAKAGQARALDGIEIK